MAQAFINMTPSPESFQFCTPWLESDTWALLHWWRSWHEFPLRYCMLYFFVVIVSICHNLACYEESTGIKYKRGYREDEKSIITSQREADLGPYILGEGSRCWWASHQNQTTWLFPWVETPISQLPLANETTAHKTWAHPATLWWKFPRPTAVGRYIMNNIFLKRLNADSHCKQSCIRVRHPSTAMWMMC